MKKMDGFVYLAIPVDRHRPIKIGVSHDPYQRVKYLRLGGRVCKSEIILTRKMTKRKHAFDIEGLLKHHFRFSRVEGEWFDVSASEAKGMLVLVFNRAKVYQKRPRLPFSVLPYHYPDELPRSRKIARNKRIREMGYVTSS